ncbi:MAG TPA: hypothetical protein VHO70_16600, partial [Chitinispirillaceae bacterium]|nr:hypothetical protein [Chitinispirillaceae bacterium]
MKIEKSITPGNVYVNDDAMDCSGSNFYVKTIRKNGSQIQKLTIVTVDRTEKQYSRVVYVVFNSDKQQIINPRIKILELLNDDGVMTVMQKNYTIEGIVEFYANRKVHYTVSLFEGNKFKDSSGITSDSSFKFYFPVALENVNTVFRVELADTQKNLVANTTLMINYCKECIDTVPPKIASVFVNNNALSSGDRFVSNKKDIRIELVFFDESGVDSVFINNTLAKRSEETSRRWYFDTVVNHITTPDTFSFYAVDKAGNHSPLKMVIAGYNTHPQIYACPDSIEHAFTGKLYISGIDIRDTDTNDFVMYTITDKKSSNIFIDEKGVIKWTPGKSDLGFHSVKIKGEDRSGFPVFYSYSIYVSDTILDTVRFVTSRNEFPILLPCTDTVNIQLKVHGGTKPFVFEINDRTKSRPIPVEKLNPFFRWKPECTSDLGSHQFFIVVRDTLRLSDTLWPVITVLPPNRPFEIIEQRWSGSLKTDSVLDLSKNRTDTLFYSIKDPDSSGYEQHTISVSIG